MNYSALAADSPCRVGLHHYENGTSFDCGEPEASKILRLTVKVEGLPLQVRPHRIGSRLCLAASRALKVDYGSEVNVIVSFADEDWLSPEVTAKVLEAFIFLRDEVEYDEETERPRAHKAIEKAIALIKGKEAP